MPFWNLKNAAMAVLLALVGVLGAFGWYTHRRAEKAEAVQHALEQARVADAAAVWRRDTVVQAVQRERKETDARLQEVLPQHQDWASTSVPDDVLDAAGL